MVISTLPNWDFHVDKASCEAMYNISVLVFHMSRGLDVNLHSKDNHLCMSGQISAAVSWCGVKLIKLPFKPAGFSRDFEHSGSVRGP